MIAGVAESRFGEVPDATALQLHQQAAALALADAGLQPTDVDGLFSCGADIMHPLILGEYLGRLVEESVAPVHFAIHRMEL